MILPPEARKPIFTAARACGAVFPTTANVAILDKGIDEAMMALPAYPKPDVDEARLAGVLRGLFGPMSQAQWDAIVAVTRNEALPAPSPEGITQIGLTTADFESAAARLACTVAQIRAVDETESGGGWFTDVRADILASDGPGGFVDGPNLPKILFEARWFDKFTAGRFRKVAPNLSSPTWNKALYVGGQAEYGRLAAAIKLDREAALKSASVGRYQIMGFNHAKAGYATVEAFWDAMKTSERAHLNAFVTFIINSSMADELRAISDDPATCRAFAGLYNGTGQIPLYSGRIAAAHKKFRRKAA